MNCLECGILVVPKRTIGRQPKFCSRTCYNKCRYRHPNDTRDTPKGHVCEVCQTPFEKKKRHQRFCSKTCYQKAWPLLNREKHNTRQRTKRAENPAWFQAHDIKYYRKHRAKLSSSRPWNYLILSARSRAKEKDIPFNLTHEWGAARWTGRCEITGLPFRSNGIRGPHPFSPSVDRRNPALGYTQENTRFILFGCNAIKGVGTDADILEIARAIMQAYSITDAVPLGLPA